MSITITEALAEIKTVAKRVEKKREAVRQFLARQDGVRDPLEKEGGSEKFITQERQAIADLNARIVSLRRGIQRANEETEITIGKDVRSIADWLVWRRDIAPGERAFLNQLRADLNGFREQAKRNGAAVVNVGAVAERPTDVVVNISEQLLSAQSETIEEAIGTLDGQLSLKNATVTIKE